ncbi:hypothetical protein Cpar_2040 [Chlorobaculum parvum NCIB 8327]|uniref:Isoprenylcysteine carboxylmethyltransferase family protein n=1 Tax=Chlorobaculum parvum (strain DSM 263 / NCIMB 8327) TaxID=517417 RepID=B3QLU1_CHLP8|nr:hypothetical protein [Chlorobaculum parvum]ACF12427.1 hypothetical protein Cpar_2040 [Chlorobaculum parvum NCIB 8327]
MNKQSQTLHPVIVWLRFVVVTTRYLLRHDPALLAERLKLAQVVKIDEARHQQVITIVLLFAMPAALGSRSALLLSLFLTLLLIVRTRLEDRTVHAELEGYPDYARQTRYRLIPGIW